MPSVLVCEIMVSKFEIQSRYYVKFQTNIPGKEMKSINPTKL